MFLGIFPVRIKLDSTDCFHFFRIGFGMTTKKMKTL